MSDCVWLSDRLSALPDDPADWSSEDLRHLDACESCRREWELVRATRGLGDGLLAAFDAGATTSAVRQRLRQARTDRTRQIRAWVFAGMAAAAAVSAVVLTGNRPDPLLRSEPVATGFRIPLPELDGLQPAELDSVLQTMERSPATGGTLESASPGNPENGDLDIVLESWEG